MEITYDSEVEKIFSEMAAGQKVDIPKMAS